MILGACEDIGGVHIINNNNHNNKHQGLHLKNSRESTKYPQSTVQNFSIRPDNPGEACIDGGVKRAKPTIQTQRKQSPYFALASGGLGLV